MKKEDLKLNNLLRAIKEIENLGNASDILKMIAPTINWSEKSERAVEYGGRREKCSDDFRSMAYQELKESTLIDLVSKELLVSEYDHKEHIPLFTLAILNKFEFLQSYLKAFEEHFPDSSIAENALRDFGEKFKSLLENVYSNHGYYQKKAYDKNNVESINNWYTSMNSIMNNPILLKETKFNSYYTQELVKRCQETVVMQWYMSLYLADPKNIKKNTILPEHKSINIEKCIKYLEKQTQYSYKEEKNSLDTATNYLMNNMPLDNFKYIVLKQKKLVDIEHVVSNMFYQSDITYSHMSYGGGEEYFLQALRNIFNSYQLSLEKVKFLYTLPDYQKNIKELLEAKLDKALELCVEENVLPLFSIYSVAPNVEWAGINIQEFLNFLKLTKNMSKRAKDFIGHESEKDIEKELNKDKSRGSYDSYSQHKNYNVARRQFMKAGFQENVLPDIKIFSELIENNEQLPNNLRGDSDKIRKLIPFTKISLSPEQFKEKIELQVQIEENSKKHKVPKI